MPRLQLALLTSPICRHADADFHARHTDASALRAFRRHVAAAAAFADAYV